MIFTFWYKYYGLIDMEKGLEDRWGEIDKPLVRLDWDQCISCWEEYFF